MEESQLHVERRTDVEDKGLRQSGVLQCVKCRSESRSVNARFALVLTSVHTSSRTTWEERGGP